MSSMTIARWVFMIAVGFNAAVRLVILIDTQTNLQTS